MTRRGGVGAVLLLAVLVAACGRMSPPPPPPTEAEARAFLDQLVALVDAGDLEAFCAIAGGACEQLLRTGDPERVPTEAPRIVGSRAVQPRRIDATTWDVGGRVLELCGRDGLGDMYESELLVFRDGDRLEAIAAPYWLGYGVAEDPVVGETPELAPTCP